MIREGRPLGGLFRFRGYLHLPGRLWESAAILPKLCLSRKKKDLGSAYSQVVGDFK